MTLIKFLSDTLCMDESDIIKFSSTSPHRYKTYEIPKRNGKGTRTIAHPAKELKFFQRLIVSHLEDKLTIHECAYAYRKGISIKNNAECHLKTKYLLKMDFENFFPSITPELLFRTLENFNMEPSASDKLILEGFLFWKHRENSSLKLSIGAPSSPFISNVIMYEFDAAMQETCNAIGITYTRYADDLTFSTNNKDLLFSIPSKTTSLLEKNAIGLIKINQDKTVFSSKAHNRHVTGITLTNDNTLSIGRNRKRLISSMIHQFSHEMLNSNEVSHLQGILSFATHIEPCFYEKMCHKYGKETLIKLKKFQAERQK